MKLKIIVPAVMAVMLILTACTSSKILHQKASIIRCFGIRKHEHRYLNWDNRQWDLILCGNRVQLRSIADSDTALAQNYIQNTNIELTSEWISIGDDEHPFTGNTTVMATPFPVFAILLVRKIYWPFRILKGWEMYNITLISPDTTMQTEPTMVLS